MLDVEDVGGGVESLNDLILNILPAKSYLSVN